MEAVRIIDRWIDYAYSNALSLGTKVTYLTIDAGLNVKQLQALACCTHMECMDINIQIGAEVALAEVVRHMPVLRELKISGAREFGYRAKALLQSREGAFLEAIKSASRLAMLREWDVHMGRKELVEILKLMGKELEEFGVTIYEKEESHFDKLEHLLYALAKHNPEIREVDLRFYLPYAWEREAKLWRMNDEGERLVLAQNRLQQAAPFFDPTPLEELRETMPSYCGIVYEPRYVDDI